MICQLCKKELKNNKALWTHLFHCHKEYSINHGQKYYDIYINSNISKKCKNPNCNNTVKFKSITYGYNNTCCKKCSDILNGINRKGKYIGIPSPNKGKKDSEIVKLHKKEARNKFLNSENGLLWRKKISERQKGINNSCHNISV